MLKKASEWLTYYRFRIRSVVNGADKAIVQREARRKAAEKKDK